MSTFFRYFVILIYAQRVYHYFRGSSPYTIKRDIRCLRLKFNRFFRVYYQCYQVDRKHFFKTCLRMVYYQIKHRFIKHFYYRYIYLIRYYHVSLITYIPLKWKRKNPLPRFYDDRFRVAFIPYILLIIFLLLYFGQLGQPTSIITGEYCPDVSRSARFEFVIQDARDYFKKVVQWHFFLLWHHTPTLAYWTVSIYLSLMCVEVCMVIFVTFFFGWISFRQEMLTAEWFYYFIVLFFMCYEEVVGDIMNRLSLFKLSQYYFVYIPLLKVADIFNIDPFFKKPERMPHFMPPVDYTNYRVKIPGNDDAVAERYAMLKIEQIERREAEARAAAREKRLWKNFPFTKKFFYICRRAFKGHW